MPRFLGTRDLVNCMFNLLEIQRKYSGGSDEDQYHHHNHLGSPGHHSEAR